MKNQWLLLSLFVFVTCSSKAQPDIALSVFSSGFSKPVDIANCGDDRLFILEQHNGRIFILDKNGVRLNTPFLQLPGVGQANEQGLLGLAFHPDYLTNGYFFINYSLPNGNSRISRFSVSANPNIAEPASEMVLLEVDQPYSNHNGGCLKFGPDGYLYAGFGDGGSGGDPQANGQNRSTLLGKILRLDVDNGSPYAIPPGNPFVNEPDALGEIWAFGNRNPWRFSFDRATGDLWIGDVGQDSWEEIDFQPAGSTGGQNYGWRCYEGNHPFNTNGCNPMNTMTFPVAEYQNTNGIGCSVTGGFVYRGLHFPQLYGHYLFTDYCTGILWSLTPDGQGGWVNQQLNNLLDLQFASFGENKNGELFVTGHANGNIYRITETSLEWSYTANVTNVLCPGDTDGAIEITFSGTSPAMTLNWSDGASGPVRQNLPAGAYEVTITAPNGATAVENFVLSSTISLDAAVTNESCPGSADGAIDLTINGAAEPSTAGWDDGANTFDRTGLSAGEYTVTIATGEGCTFVQNFVIATEFDNPVTPFITVENATILHAPAGYATYQWLLNGGEIAGATSADFTATVSGEYSVVVTNEGGCEATSATVVVITGTQELLPGFSRLLLTPNPFDGALHLSWEAGAVQRFVVSLTDSMGKQHFHQIREMGGTGGHTFDLAGLPAGAYLFTVSKNEKTWSQKVIKR
ncbi:MAG: T9SS type A sorting domain-containing protein [Saprospiraceae bacterium]|nr:MAG: T9SS type A sorting domain-containing protein [Saprospiraceae bacterium]